MVRKKTKQFEVLENESIADCLERMKKEGYTPVRRIEKPVFKEARQKNGEESFEYAKQVVKFEGVHRENTND
jgi:hypothetical protein